MCFLLVLKCVLFLLLLCCSGLMVFSLAALIPQNSVERQHYVGFVHGKENRLLFPNGVR